MSDTVELDYDYLMQNALRYLMRDVLELVAEIGDAPGEHHFYIEFITRAPGVSIPDELLETYPNTMTIVLQHQFEELVVTDEGFSVTLWFKNIESNLRIPYDAVVSFADPSAKFGLRFGNEDTQIDDGTVEDDYEGEHGDASVSILPAAKKTDADQTADDTDKDKSAAAEDSAAGSSPTDESESADIVSLDSFRKK